MVLLYMHFSASFFISMLIKYVLGYVLGLSLFLEALLWTAMSLLKGSKYLVVIPSQGCKIMFFFYCCEAFLKTGRVRQSFLQFQHIRPPNPGRGGILIYLYYENTLLIHAMSTNINVSRVLSKIYFCKIKWNL